MSLSVREPLTFRATDGEQRTYSIAYAHRHAMIVAEVELREITVKVLLFAVLVHAAHTALKDTEEAFDRVSGYVATGIFLDGVAHSFVLRDLFAHAGIKAAFVRMQAGFAVDVLAHDVGNNVLIRRGYVERADTTATLD